MLGTFLTERNFGVSEQLWVEAKVLSASRFDEGMAKLKGKLAESLLREQLRSDKLQVVLLVAARVERGSKNFSLVAKLFTTASALWSQVAGGCRRAGRGQCRGWIPSSAKLWQKVEWQRTVGNTKVGLLARVLKARVGCL